MFTKLFSKVDKILFLWLACFVINIITFFWVRYKINPGNRIMALHYNIVVGVDWYGLGKNLYSIPIAALIITIANFVLAKSLKANHFLLSFLAVIISIIVQLILFVAVLFLSGVN